ncbi:hypothetical protein QNH10_17545 [Sporosarcina thermotolerans]|uniref:hypothetical protein n=1 Tax=Sporosarcina thermotolerans TaxID=633404 RepID=UPI0024BC9E31|nr:hypothetical protein [Sporosarcina thermotolerans]WHT47872.1 hypothetical protein QNH10_17545 [Sporosarcina thermotolerans]
MMTIRRLLPIFGIILLLSGCIPNEFTVENHTGEDAKEAEDLIKKDDRIKGAATLFHDDHLIVGIRVKTFDRFNKRKIAKELEKKLTEIYPISRC